MSPEFSHEFLNPPCPWLPEIRTPRDFTFTRRHGGDRGAAFYRDALCFAQSQWRCGKPAQAILQLDKAWMADLRESPEILDEYPPPYLALAWILNIAAGGDRGYLGNPVRHFQHLASRISGERREIRSWRAWSCMHLAGRLLPGPGFPRDGRQLAREGIFIPSLACALARLHRDGWPGEADHAAVVADG